MTADDEFDRALVDWLGSEARPPTPFGGVERVLTTTRGLRPRPAWLAGRGSHWVGETSAAGMVTGVRPIGRRGLRPAIAIVVLLVALTLAGAALLLGSRPTPPVSGRGHLAYVLDGDVFLADWDGADAVRIADGVPNGTDGCGSFGAEGPMWSPDGRHLAYRGQVTDCQQMVYIADSEGQTVASFPGEGWLVSWSPDSSRVAVWVTLGKTIAIYRLDGVRLAVLDLPDGKGPTGDYDPTWSPDGQSLLIRLGPPSPSTVWEIPIDGSPARQVPAADPRSNPDAAFSRDGSRVAFVPYLESRSLVMARADGSELLVLPGARNDLDGIPQAGDYHADPIWSPSGDRVAYSWSDDPFYTPTGAVTRTLELRVVDVASGKVTSLVSATHIRPIVFSDDGKRILFQRAESDTSVDASLWSAEADGSSTRTIVAGTSAGDWQWPR